MSGGEIVQGGEVNGLHGKPPNGSFLETLRFVQLTKVSSGILKSGTKIKNSLDAAGSHHP